MNDTNKCENMTTGTSKISLIGISDAFRERLSEPLMALVAEADYFAGGVRHRERVAHLLPGGRSWLDITIPLDAFLRALKEKKGHGVIFASGDPLFFGIANTIQREFPELKLEVYPSFNSLQLLAHREKVAYGEYRVVSLTGRDWGAFDQAVIDGCLGLALLTDRRKTPVDIAQRLLDGGYTNYCLLVGECMGGEEEQVYKLSLQEAVQSTFKQPNCCLLTRLEKRRHWLGIPDSAFECLLYRPKMMTKMPVRLTTLALMQLHGKQCLWDVGACTGSVSIEAKLKQARLNVQAFEIRPESEGIIRRNCQKFGALGVGLNPGDFLQIEKGHLPVPDVVFLGGYGGKMAEVLTEIDRYLIPGGLIAFNAVSELSARNFMDWAQQNAYTVEARHRLAVDEFNPITILTIQKTNNHEQS